VSNTRQQNTAVQMYAQDYDETLPMNIYVHDAANKVAWTLFDELYVYERNAQIDQCPTDPWAIDLDARMGEILMHPDKNVEYASYAYNKVLFGDGASGVLGNGPVRTLSEIPYPTAEPTLYDGWLCGGSWFYSPISARHREGLNVAYLDGHTKRYKASLNLHLDPSLVNGQHIDAWIIGTGPFRSADPNHPNYEFAGIVIDPDCANPADNPCVTR
jgi:prepilin-type processing-associated H-X9-DG protein